MDIKTPKTKVCTKCGKRKALEKFCHTIKRGKPYVRPSCFICSNAQTIAWRLANPDKAKAATLNWVANNTARYREKARANTAAYRKANPDKVRAAYARCTKNLTDGIVASVYFRMKVKDVPPALIEAKRIQLQINRFIKNGHE